MACFGYKGGCVRDHPVPIQTRRGHSQRLMRPTSTATWSNAEGMFASARGVITAIFDSGAPWLDAKVCKDRAGFLECFSGRRAANVDAMLAKMRADVAP